MTTRMNHWHFFAGFLVMCTAASVAWAASPEPREPSDRVSWPAALPTHRPFLECTPEELTRLRDAWKKGGPEGEPITAVIQRAEDALKKPLDFPPRGGQHNQWYQCDACQLALKTVDASHHQCPKCKQIYSGEPYDDVLFAKVHNANLRRALDAAWAYAITQRPEFAIDAKAVLLGYADRYLQYPYHDNQRKTGNTGGRLNEQTLGEAVMVANFIAPAIDLLCDDAALSKDEREKINEGLLAPMLANVAKNKAGKSNWQSWHNAALFAGGALLNDEKMMRATIDSPTDGFLHQMHVSVSEEGMWYENSWSYHAYTLQALTQHVEFARRCGVDLWKLAPFQKMFTLPARYTMPDGSLPRFGDAVGSSQGASADNLESAFHALKDPALLVSLSTTPTFSSVRYGRDPSKRAAPSSLTSEVFPGAGHAILRSSAGSRLAAVITFGPYGGFHGHFDKLSFVLFGHGRELGVDPGRALSQAYRLPIHGNWYKATISHNAVLVDGKSQGPVEGKLLAFGFDQSRALAVTECNKAYEKVQHRRLLAVGPSYALVVDTLAAARPSVFDWVYHNRGKDVDVPGLKPAGKIEPLANLAGQEYVRWKLATTTDAMPQVTFGDGDFQTFVITAASPGTILRAGDGVGASVEDRVPMMLLRRQGDRAVFAVVIEPRAGNEPSQVSSVETQTQGDALIIKVMHQQSLDVFHLHADGTCEFKPAEGASVTATLWRGK